MKINLVKAAKKMALKKFLPSNTFEQTIYKLKKFKAKFEFSYFFISSATNILTHVDGEKHKIKGTSEDALKVLIKLLIQM